MNLTVFTAVTGPWEAPLVSSLESERTGVAVVRRCVDLTDLLAVASTGQAQAALVSADLHRLDREALTALAGAGLAVVGLHAPSEAGQARRLEQLGVVHVLPADSPGADVAAAVAAAVLAVAQERRPDRNAVADPAASLPRPRTCPADDEPLPFAEPETTGRLIAVWGPVGSPGRSTVAVTLAAELAALGESTLLVDADTYGASIAQTVGLLDEAPGLAAACRFASAGSLDRAGLARLALRVAPQLRVLTGVSRSSRWPEISGSALSAVWPVARRVAAWTVVDCGFCLERDEELSYDVSVPRRNASTLVTLEQADVVLAVGAGDPVGLQRLVRGLGELAEVLPASSPQVLVTRVRSSAVGVRPQRRICEALGRYAGVEDVVMVPDDRAGCDVAMLAGRTLTEAVPSSPARRAMTDLALSLVRRSRRSRAARRAAGRAEDRAADIGARMTEPAADLAGARGGTTSAVARHSVRPTRRGRMAG